jgi:hypothetical protein
VAFLFLCFFKIFFSVGKFVDHVFNVIGGFGLLVGFFEELLFEFFNLILKLSLCIYIKSEFSVEQNIVVTLMFHFFNFAHSSRPVIFWVVRVSLAG